MKFFLEQRRAKVLQTLLKALPVRGCNLSAECEVQFVFLYGGQIINEVV